MTVHSILVTSIALILCACESEHPKNVQDSTEPQSWRQWGRTSARNNVALDQDLPLDWEAEYGDERNVIPARSRHVRWSAEVNSHGYRGMSAAPPAVADGKIFVGSNNEAGYIAELKKEDLGVLVCLREIDGEFLWQHGSKRLEVGKISDWELMTLCSTPYVVGDRLWYVNNRCEVVCLDTEGFHDGENDGISSELRTGAADADVIWTLDMRAELKVNPHNFTSSSITGAGDLIFLNTGNGVTFDHGTPPNPEAPSFIALDKKTGALVWADDSPGNNILHGSWSSPAYGVFDGAPQVIFAGGDGWLYSFDPKGDGNGGSRLLWKFDCNPKKSAWLYGRPRGIRARNNIVGFPVIYEGLVYVATGQEAEHGSGKARLLCINPKMRGDVSAELVYNRIAPETVLPARRDVACNVEAGDFTRENPNSALRWTYEELDRCCGTPAIADGHLVIGDSDGMVHFLNATTGELHWTYPTQSRIFSAPLIAGGHVYIGTEDGEVITFRHSAEPSAAEPVRVVELHTGVYAPAIAVDDVLYVLASTNLIAIGAEMKE